uniref:lysis system i-spanin subunit Rz n=1 Tax=Yersinia rohdei TaxID=29485 RepID=UPI003703C138
MSNSRSLQSGSPCCIIINAHFPYLCCFDSARRDYINLRERISTTTTMIDGLQYYISNVCLR